MTDQPEHPDLATALVAFQAEMPKVAKSSRADAGSYSYTYAAFPDVSDAAIPILTHHGLSFTCLPGRNEDGSYELRGLLRHTSGESDSGSLPIMGRQMQDIGSAISYGRRYLLGCMTGLVTDDDDDGAIAQAAKERTQSYRPPTPGETLLADLNALSENSATFVRANWPHPDKTDPATLNEAECEEVRLIMELARQANMEGS